MHSSSPLELRAGSTGAGVFVGCGAGLGVITPVSLHSIPVLGQLAASLSTSLGSLNHASGGLFGAARGRVRALGVRGLDMGFGCGVMMGYGWGAGVFVKPTALQSLAEAAQAAGQLLVARLPKPMQAALREQQQRRQQQQPGLNLGGSSGAWQPPNSEDSALLGVGSSTQFADDAVAAASSQPLQAQQQQQQQQKSGQADEVAQLTKLVLRQQNQLGELQQTVDILQAAVCKVDRTAPGCKKKS